MSPHLEPFYEFGAFQLVPAERQLLCEGRPVALPPKALDTLVVLVENAGRALRKDDLMKMVWPDAFVEESNLNHYVSVLRKTLSQYGGGDGCIETVRGHGYRFTPDVRYVSNGDAELLWRRQTRSHVSITEEVREYQTHPSGEAAGSAGPRTRLSWQKLALGLLAATILAASWLLITRFAGSRRSAEVLPVGKVKTIAVLPFKPLGVDSGDEYLGLGMADALITRLGQIKQLNIRPTGAVQKYVAAGGDAAAIGRELNVDAVLDGRLQRADGRLRVTTQLLSVREGVVLWTGAFDLNDDDLFKVEDSITGEVARAVMPQVTNEDKARLAKRYTENAEAYQAYLKGRFFWNKRTPTDTERSIEYFRQAINLDPNFALAYAGLADAYNFSFRGPAEKQPLVKAAVTKALELDEALPEAHATLANLALFDDWNWDGAEQEFQRALDLNPNYATAHHWYAYDLACQARLDQALAEIRRAQELDPLSLIINTDLGQLLYFAHDYDRSIEQLRKTLEMDPNFFMAHVRLAEVYEQIGMYKEATAEFQKAPLPGLTYPSPGVIGPVYALSGDRSGALRMIKLLEKGGERYYFTAEIYARLGDADQAFPWLEKSRQGREVELSLIKVNPAFDKLRSDPRYQDLLRRMNLG